MIKILENIKPLKERSKFYDIQHQILETLFEFVDTNSIKPFTHQVMRGNDLNQEFVMIKRGFEFYAGIRESDSAIICNFNKGDNFEFTNINDENIEEAKNYLLKEIRTYMIQNSIYNFK